MVLMNHPELSMRLTRAMAGIYVADAKIKQSRSLLTSL